MLLNEAFVTDTPCVASKERAVGD